MKEQSKNNHGVAMGAIFAIILAAIAAFGTYMVVDRINSEDKDDLNTQVKDLQKEVNKLTQDAALNNLANQSLENTNLTNQSGNSQPVIVFEPGGLFDDATKTEITTKLVEPFVDYNNDSGTPSVASIHITTPDSNPGPWEIFAIRSDGSYGGFLFGSNEFQTQQWWTPECLGGCNFSDDFKVKYPEVIQAATN